MRTHATIAALTLVCLSGCATYKLGPCKPKFMDGVHTIAVPNFHNHTLEPHIETLVTTTIIKQIQQDGTLQVAREADADVTLKGRIDEVRRHARRSVRGNVRATREFELQLVLEYELIRNSTGELLNHGRIIGSSNFFVSNDVQTEETVAIPTAVEEAAVDLVSSLTEGW
jgi:hypothetical protein